MATVRVLVLRAPGTNCDVEAQFAFQRVNAFADCIHINRVRENPGLLRDYQILVIPGGFSYGDDVAAGKILANQMSHFFGEALRAFRDNNKLILGICNGFQALLKSGLIIPPDDDGPVATLAHNASAKFEDRWVHLAVHPGKCPFLQGIEQLYVPIAHGEGRLVTRSAWQAQGFLQAGLAVLRYTNPASPNQKPGYPDNPNGSTGDIAGLCDITGRVLGLMPHPERHVIPTQHPHWTRVGLQAEGAGLAVFRNAVRFFA